MSGWSSLGETVKWVILQPPGPKFHHQRRAPCPSPPEKMGVTNCFHTVQVSTVGPRHTTEITVTDSGGPSPPLHPF